MGISLLGFLLNTLCYAKDKNLFELYEITNDLVFLRLTYYAINGGFKCMDKQILDLFTHSNQMKWVVYCSH